MSDLDKTLKYYIMLHYITKTTKACIVQTMVIPVVTFACKILRINKEKLMDGWAEGWMEGWVDGQTDNRYKIIGRTTDEIEA